MQDSSRRVADSLEHGWPVVAAAALAHDAACDLFACCLVVGIDAGEAFVEGGIFVDVRKLAVGLQGAGLLIDDLGQCGAERLQVIF